MDKSISGSGRFWKPLLKIARRAGAEIIYKALQLYYAFQRPELPKWAKTTILGALTYLLAPIDAIPDLTPLLGYTDDLGVLSIALVTVAGYINQTVRQQALDQTQAWIGPVFEDPTALLQGAKEDEANTGSAKE